MRAAHIRHGFEKYYRWWGLKRAPSPGVEGKEVSTEPVVRGSLTPVVDTLQRLARGSLTAVVNTLHPVAQIDKTEG